MCLLACRTCITCVCFSPNRIPLASSHLSNVLIDRTLNELVAPLRKLNLKEEEIVPLKAIIILNPSKNICFRNDLSQTN